MPNTPNFGVKELAYIVGALASFGGLYVAVLTSDAKQSAQIEALQKGRDENREQILELVRQNAESRAEMKELRAMLLDHDSRDRKEAHP